MYVPSAIKMSTSVENVKRHVLLTGPPGIGKTTLVKKVCDQLVNANIPTRGFFTEEIRNAGKRIGFDIVALDGKRGILARQLQSGTGTSHCMVGQYAVSVQSFENIALPVFPTQQNADGILVLDEIGRMELFSNQFKQEVMKAFMNTHITILATIPVPKAKPLPFIESLRQRTDATVLMVDRSNRDNLVDQVFDMLTKT